MKHKIIEYIGLAAVVLFTIGGALLVGKYAFSETEFVTVEKPEEPVEKNPLKIIKEVCEENGCDWTICIRVAAEESKFKPYARYVNKKGTIDRGVFMFNDTHFKQVDDDCAYDIRCATKMFCEEVKKGNLKAWVAAVNLGLTK